MRLVHLDSRSSSSEDNCIPEDTVQEKIKTRDKKEGMSKLSFVSHDES